jgi:hypothetical protein
MRITPIKNKVMLKEDYCSFEVAKLLKEKGFNEPIRCWYDNTKDFHESGVKMRNSDCINPTIMCPTHQMAIAYLRKKGIAIIPIISSILDNEKFLWNVNIIIAKTGETCSQGWVYESYESIVDNALEYVLKNLI